MQSQLYSFYRYFNVREVQTKAKEFLMKLEPDERLVVERLTAASI